MSVSLSLSPFWGGADGLAPALYYRSLGDKARRQNGQRWASISGSIAVCPARRSVGLYPAGGREHRESSRELSERSRSERNQEKWVDRMQHLR